MSSEAGRTDVSQSELKSPGSGVPSWPSEPVWDKDLTAKQILQLPAAREDERTGKDMVGLVQACPRQATCPGLPSVFEDRQNRWIFGEELLLPGSSSNSMIENLPGPVCPAPICPGGGLWGLPSLPEPGRRPLPASVLRLLPLCPVVSAVAGFASAEGGSEAGWLPEARRLIFSQPKKPKCGISGSPSGCERPGSGCALAPSCPRRSRTPGFPSVPGYNMLTLLPVCPNASVVPGCGSEGSQGPSKGLWPYQPCTLFDRPMKATPSVAYGPGPHGGSAKDMFRLVPCCPEACGSPGFPSHPRQAPKVGFTVVSLAHCCSSASGTEGLGPAAPGTGWAELAEPILMWPREKEAETPSPFGGQPQEHGHSMINMATSCPTESQVHGCPSAPPVDRPPEMVSLYAPASCFPCIPGFPSSRTPTAECVPKQPQVKAFPQRPHKDRKVLESARSEREVDMAAVTPSCPRLAASPGFPSISHPSPSDSKAAGEAPT